MRKLSKRKVVKKIDPGKKVCQGWHAIKRAKERLGIRLSEEDLEQLCSCIKNEKEHPSVKYKFVKKQSNRNSLYKISFENKEAILVYDTFRKSIVTFLPMDALKNIYTYIDIFGNTVSIKDQFGVYWKVDNNELTIPGDTVTFNKRDDCWTVQDGVLEGKCFRMCLDTLYEV